MYHVHHSFGKTPNRRTLTQKYFLSNKQGATKTMFTFNSSSHNPLRRGLALAVLLLVLLSGLLFAQPSYAYSSGPDLIISGSFDENCRLIVTITNMGNEDVQIQQGHVWSVDSVMSNGEFTSVVAGGPSAFLEANGGTVTTAGSPFWTGYSNPLTLTVFPVSGESNVDNNTIVIDVPAECQACIGDVDFDGDVDADDIQLIREHILGISQLSPEAQEVADANGDGEISGADIVQIMRQPCYEICMGDVDFDGDVDADDIQLIREHILGISQLSPEAQKVADANGDGQISTFDLVLIMRQPCFQG